MMRSLRFCAQVASNVDIICKIEKGPSSGRFRERWLARIDALQVVAMGKTEYDAMDLLCITVQDLIKTNGFRVGIRPQTKEQRVNNTFVLWSCGADEELREKGLCNEDSEEENQV